LALKTSNKAIPPTTTTMTNKQLLGFFQQTLSFFAHHITYFKARACWIMSISLDDCVDDSSNPVSPGDNEEKVMMDNDLSNANGSVVYVCFYS